MTKKEFLKQLDSLESLGNEIVTLNKEFDDNSLKLQTLVDKMQVDNYRTIVEAVKPEHDSDETREKISGIHKLTRNVGRRFFNLFRVTFSVEFAGVQLIYFQIPKLKENE